VSPNVVAAGGPGFTLTVNGANFIASSVVQWNGSARATAVVSSTQLQGSIMATDIAAGANNMVTVANPAGQGGVSAGFALTVNNPVPALSGVSPTALAAGGPAFTLTVTGSNFVPTSVVQFNGAARPTTFVSSTTLQAAIPSADISSVGLSSVTVLNPTPAGGTSGKLTFTAAFPPPRIKLMAPGSAVRGGGDFTVTVTGTGFVPSSAVSFNGSPRTTTFISSTELQATITAADISAVGVSNVTVVNVVTNIARAQNANIDPTTSSPFTFFTGDAGGPGFAQVIVNQTAQDIVYDSSQQLIYASVPSTASTNPNTVSVLSLATAAITSSTGTGKNPDVLAISDDNQFLYAGIDGSASVQRFALPGLGTDISYSLGSDFFGPFFALDLQAAPGAPHTTAVSRGSSGVSPRAQGGIVIFDDATPRPTIAKGFDSGNGLYDSIQWGSDATSIVAANTDDTGFDFYTLSVNAGGVSQTKDVPSAFGSFANRIHFDRGTNLVYSDEGRTLDPATGVAAGVFAASGVMVPDSSLNMAFVISQASGNTATIQSFDLTHFTPVGSITVTNVSGGPRRLIRWGQNGLAFNTSSGQIVVVGGSFVSPVPATFPAPHPLPTPPPTPAGNAPVITLLNPSSAIAGNPGFTLTVTGTNFDPAAVVQFNGAPLATTFNSGTQLQAAVPTGNIASSGTAIITVVNPANNGGVSAGSTFFIGATGGSNFAVSAINQSANDLVFDPLHQVILLSVPSTAAAHGNTISALDPGSETIISSQFAGSEPGVLALSDDSQFLYAGINGAAKVQRFTLPGLATDVSFSLGNGGFAAGPNIPLDLQVAPGAPHTTAVTTQSGTITVFDDATPRAGAGGGGNSIQWSTDATTLFSSGSFGGGDLFTFSAAAGGLTRINAVPLDIGSRIHFDRGDHLLWTENGHVVDPVAGSPVAILGASGPTVPDSGLNLVFVLNRSFTGLTLNAYDMTHFTLVGSITIPNVNGNPRRLIRWGQNGLAFNTDNGQVFLVGGNFVSAVPASFPPPNPLPAPPPAPAANAPAITLLSPSSAVAGGSSFTLTVTGTKFDPAAVVQFNGTPLSVTSSSSTQLQATVPAAGIASSGTAIITVANPVSSGGVSAGSTFFIGASGGSNFAVSAINQSANDLVFDPQHQVILLSVPSTAPAHGNTISALDPLSENIISSQFAGSEPGVLSLSDDNQFLYAGIDGSASVQRFALPGMGRDASYPIGSDPFFGPYFTLDLQAAPGAPHTSAVSRGLRGSSPQALGGIEIFDDATPRSTMAPGFGSGGLYDSIQWGHDATSMVAANSDDTGFDFYILSVNANGISQTKDIQSAFASFNNQIHFDRGTNLVYSNDGRALDPATGLPGGTFKAFGHMVPDSSLNTAFFLNQTFGSSSVTIQSFDMTHFTPVGSITIPNVNGNARRLIRWGQNGLAFNTDNGQVFLVGGSFVSAVPATFPAPNPLPAPPPTPAVNAPVISLLNPSSAIAGSPTFTLTVTGSNFDPAAVVQFNGTALSTTFNSSTQLQATVLTGNIGSPGTAIITVANPPGNGGVSAGSTFFIGATGGSNFAVSAINQSANDLIYDPLNQVILLSVPSTAAAHGNTISALDPASETIISSQFAGSEPGVLALSDDSQFLYAGINGAAKVQRFTLPSLGTDVSYSLGSGGFIVGANTADDLEVAPGLPHTSAVTTPGGVITVFDDAVPRAGTGSGGTSIQWGTDATTMFSPDRFGSDLLTFAAAVGGLTQTSDVSLAIGGKIHFDRGDHLLWAENGHVVDPVAGSPVAVLAASGLTVPDSTLNVAFVLTQSFGTKSVTINAFDMTHFTLVGSITIPNVSGNARRLIRWGQNGLAFNTDQGQVFVVGGNFVSAVPATTPSPTPLPAPPPAPAANAPAITLLNPSSALAGGNSFTITVNGTNFDPAAQVQFNGSSRTTTFVSSTQLTATINQADITSAGTGLITVANPIANGGVSSGSTFFIGSSAGSNFAVSVINQASNDLVFDPLHQVILLSVPGGATSHGNTISAIDLSGNVISSQFAGSEPDVLALSGDSTFVYAGIDGASRVQRFALPAFTVDTSYSLGVGFLGLTTAQDLQVAPGAPHTTAVVNAQANPTGQITIFDDATPRTNTVNDGNSIQWGAGTSTLFSSVAFSGSDLLSFAVNGSGLTSSHDFPSILSGRRIHFDPVTSRIYADGGGVVDPATGLPIATFQAAGLMVVDSQLNAAYFLEQPFNSGNATIDSFDLTRFVKTGSITISGVGGSAHRLVRWGQNGLAFNTSDGHLFMIGGNFVSPISTAVPAATPLPTPPPPIIPGLTTPTIASLSPGSATKGGPDVALTVNGKNFTASSAVQFNGSSLTTTFVSASQLTATIPAADIVTGGASQVTVTDPSSGTSNPSSFFVGGAAGTGTGGATFASTIISQASNDFIFDPVHQVFLISVPSTGGTLGNTVTALDLSGNVISSQFAGSDPGVLGVSDDGQFLYAGINGASRAQRFALPSFSPDINYSLGTGVAAALDLQVEPGAAHTAAFVTGAPTSPFPTDGTVVFDDATQRTNRAFTEASSIQWGAAKTTLLGADAFGRDLLIMAVDANGVTGKSDFFPFTNATRIRFNPATGLVYGNDGHVVDPATGMVQGSYAVGSFASSNLMIPDSGLGKAFFLTQTANAGQTTVTIQSFDLTKLNLISSMTIANLNGTVQSLVRWGTNGLAFNTNQGQIVLLGGSFVN